MILWFSILQIGVAAAAAVFSITAGLIGRRPSDWSVGALALIELMLIAQVVIAIVAPISGNPPAGDLLEFWTYLISAVLIPPAAVVWAFVDRSRWSTVVLGVAALALAIMLWRMQTIWGI